MKKVVLFICMLFMIGCATSGPIVIMENEPTNFRGIEFGTSLENLSDMIIEYQDGLLTRCIRKDDKMEMLGAKVDKIYYTFYKGIFYEGRVLLKGLDNFYNIRAALYQRHGSSLEATTKKEIAKYMALSGTLEGAALLMPGPRELHSWVSETIYISLEYTNGEGILNYLFILDEMKK